MQQQAMADNGRIKGRLEDMDQEGREEKLEREGDREKKRYTNTRTYLAEKGAVEGRIIFISCLRRNILTTKLDAFQQWCLWIIMRIPYSVHIRDAVKLTGTRDRPKS